MIRAVTDPENMMTIGPRPAHIALALDNDVLNDWRAKKPATVQAITEYTFIAKVPPALTSTTVFELLYGFEKSLFKSETTNERTLRDKEYAQLLTRDCDVLPFNEDAAGIAAYIFSRLAEKDRNKHWRDVFIASTALAHNYGVATRNKDDYELISKHTPLHHPPLRIQIWKT